MDHFKIGAAEVVRIEETMVHFDGREFFPDLTESVLQEHAAWLAPFFDIPGFRMPCVFQSFVIRYGTLDVLVDTCIGNHKERPDFLLAHRLDTPYLARLHAAGLRPEDIDIVLCTHLHVDHVGWNTRLDNGRWVPTFPNARYVFSREEYARYAPENLVPGAPPPFFDVYQDSVLPIVESGQASMVSGEHALNEIMTVVPTPGHTPGHIGLRVQHDGRSAFFLGDAIHSPIQIAVPDLNSSFCEDQALARASRHRLLSEAADRGSLLVPGHFVAPHVGHVARDGAAYRFLPAGSNRGRAE
ncbi:MAG: MBL fold metallo-hydrolase [Gammaproteobacteria bacterium]|nr:MBL fold metallo-hydrolase [Gammaproteobacteria bacterium]